MFCKAITTKQRGVLEKLVANNLVNDYYLVGSSALALHLGHREPSDLVWFTPNIFDHEQIQYSLENIGDFELSFQKPGTCHGFIDGVQISFLYYPYPCLKPPLITARFKFKVAALEDVGVMKLIAVSQRGARKDFIDLYYLHQKNITLKLLINLLETKFPTTSLNYYHIIKSLVYFEDADREPMPKLFNFLSWDAVKEFFVTQQEDLLHLVENIV